MSEAIKGKKVVLTGACGIFGGRIARVLGQNGAELCLSDMRQDALETLAGEMSDRGVKVLTHVTQLEQETSMDALLETVSQQWKAPDILINNAGVYPSGELLDLTLAEWDRIFSVNLRAPFKLAQGFARQMVAQGVKGNIIHISSGAARSMRVSVVPYCVSKTALDRLNKGMALEFAPHGIRVNIVEPGFAAGSVVSPLTNAHVQAVEGNIPLGRPSGEEDAANAIMYLCSQKAGFITGASLAVDGGNSLGRRADSSPK